MRFFLLVTVLFLVTGCGSIRDVSVYSAEVQFVDLTVHRSAPSVRRVLETSCVCDTESVSWTSTDERVSSETCEANADWYRVYLARWDWHMRMMRYNGSVEGAEDPGPVPEVSRTCDLGVAP